MSPFPTPCKGKSMGKWLNFTFALTGRMRLCIDTQGVALGCGLAALSGRSFSRFVRLSCAHALPPRYLLSKPRRDFSGFCPPNLLICSLFQQLIPITILRRIDIGKRFVNGLFVLPCSFPLVNTNQFVAFVFREKLR